MPAMSALSNRAGPHFLICAILNERLFLLFDSFPTFLGGVGKRLAVSFLCPIIVTVKEHLKDNEFPGNWENSLPGEKGKMGGR